MVYGQILKKPDFHLFCFEIRSWARYLFVCTLLTLPFSSLSANLAVNVFDHNGKSLKGIVVYLTSENGQSTGANLKPINIQQKDRKFVPYLAVAQANQSVVFDNLDDITHHIYAVTGPARFSFKLKADKQSKEIALTKQGVVPMGCNIHDWMSGYLLVIQTPFYAITDSSGVVKFKDLPGGLYQVFAWHPQFDEPEELSRSVQVPEQQVTQLQLTRPMAIIPDQESENDFDFLEDY